MGRFIPWFTLSIEHSYFVDSLWRGVAFIPTPSTERMAKNAGQIFKEVDGGIAVLADEERTSALSYYAQEGGGSVHFWFKAYAKNRSFASFTSLPTPEQGRVLFFENRPEAREEGGKRVLLSRGANVSASDLVQMDALIAAEGLCSEDRRVPPDFVVHLIVAPPVTSAEAPLDFGVRFEARQAFLKYYLLGNLNRSNAFIVDLDNKIEFESCGEQELPGRLAKVFRSKQRISVRERSSYRFQLREQGQSGGKVLIKRLPVASEGRLGSEVVDGKAEPIFEAYVNC